MGASGLDEMTVALPVEQIARAVAGQVRQLLQEDHGPTWLTKDEALAHSKIPKGTFEKLAAEGRIPSHGGKTKVFNRQELDKAIKAL